MKQEELQQCAICDRGMMHSGSPIFYKVSIASMVIDLKAVQQQHGLEIMLGAAAPLATTLGPNTDIAHQADTKDILICYNCAMDKKTTILEHL